MKRSVFLSLAVFVIYIFNSQVSHGVLAQENILDVETIVDKVDKLYRSRTSQGQLEMTIVSENWTRTLKMEVWTEGLDSTFIHISYPRKDAGIATLRIKNEMWNYFPKINKVMKVPPSMMMSSWMGSDFTNDDLVKESSMKKDYVYRLIHPEDAEPSNYYIELIPKKDIPIVWDRIHLVVRKKDYIPVLQVYFDEKGRKMREMVFSEIKTFSGREIPSVLEMTPLNKPGKKTVIIYRDIKFDIKLEKDVFTLRNLQKKR
ncbi:MAG: outer membrane lipoprotein-sorting protein [Nitrospiraceae bacterium]|nr:MAG: outer membrane lipoprotein-sorting protein [Nitrospiraceae bacterium]